LLFFEDNKAKIKTVLRPLQELW